MGDAEWASRRAVLLLPVATDAMKSWGDELGVIQKDGLRLGRNRGQADEFEEERRAWGCVWEGAEHYVGPTGDEYQKLTQVNKNFGSEFIHTAGSANTPALIDHR